jgi:hypothetical protein
MTPQLIYYRKKLQMADPTNCPIPQVATALKPYIRPRQEIQEIRKYQTASLSASIPNPTSTSITPATLVCPSIDSNNDDTLLSSLSISTSTVSPLQAEYLAALRAHAAAQKRYEDASNSLSAFAEEKHQPQTSNTEAVNTHIKSLLTTKAQHRLDTLSRASAQLAAREPVSDIDEIKEKIRNVLGEVPVPPASSEMSGFVGGTDQERLRLLVSKIKRAVIQARAAAEEAGRERETSEAHLREVNGHHGTVSDPVRAKAIEAARELLVGWIEEQLGQAQQAEAEAEEYEEETAPLSDSDPQQSIPADEVHARVGELYQRYVAARQELLETSQSAISHHSDNQSEQQRVVSHAPSASISAPISSTAFSKVTPNSGISLLSTIPTLLQTNRSTSALLTQTSTLRQTISVSGNNNKSLLARLAGESQLVAPDATEIEAWTSSSAETRARTNELVETMLNEGWDSVNGASGSLRGWGLQKGVGISTEATT